MFEYAIVDPKKTYKIDEAIEVTAEPKIELLDEGYEADEADYTNTIEIPAQRRYVEKWDDLNKEDQAYVLEEFQDFVESKVDKKEGTYVIYDRGKSATVSNFVEETGESKIEEAYFLFVNEDKYEELSEDRKFVPSNMRIVYKGTVTTEVSILNKYSDDTYDYYTVVGTEHLIMDENDELVRAELKFKLYRDYEMHKKTVVNANINILKEDFTVDEIKLEK